MRDARNDERRSDLLAALVKYFYEAWSCVVNPSRAESEIGCLEISTTRLTTTKEKEASSSRGRKAANSRECSPGTSILENSQVGSFNYEKQSET